MNHKLTNSIEKYLGGLAFAVLLGALAFWFAGLSEALDSLVVGIVLGMAMRTLIGDRFHLLPGLDLAPRIFIPLGVISYGINLKFNRLTEVPWASWLQLTIGMAVIFLVAIHLGRRLGIKDRISLLIATGTAICGASAIAIATPLVKADSEDAGASVITITIFGLFGLLLYPLAITYFSLTNSWYSILCATTLHMTGLVEAATQSIGADFLRLALSIKLARTALIIPTACFLCWFAERDEGTSRRNIFLRIPWFMWIFVLVGLVSSFVPGLGFLTVILKPWAGIFFTIALTSIGLTVDLKRMLNVGGAPLAAGLACWISAIMVFVIFYILI